MSAFNSMPQDPPVGEVVVYKNFLDEHVRGVVFDHGSYDQRENAFFVITETEELRWGVPSQIIERQGVLR